MKRRSASTLRDVARVAGVSIPTASQALNGRSGVSSETRTRVHDAAHKLRYTPHAAARRLITGRTDSIAVVPGSNMTGIFSDRFYRPILTGVGGVFESAGYRMLIAPAPRVTSAAPQFVRMVRAREVDGILAVGIVGSRWIVEVTESDIPVVLIDNQFPELAVPAVVNDDAWGAVLATLHLAGLGHRRIGFVGAINDELWARETRTGYAQALAQAGLLYDPAIEILVANDVESARQGGHTLLSLAERPSAIFAASGKMAIGIMKAARDRGLAVPQELSVVGTGDSEFALMTDPPLTAVNIHTEELGQRAAQLLLGLIHGNPAPASIVVRPDLIVRGTSGSSR
jgi:LacI family transcriptional regulator